MRIIILFSDDNKVYARVRKNDLVIIVRDENQNLVIKNAYLCVEKNKLHDLNEDMFKLIRNADKINLEILAHSSRGVKQIQSEPTATYKRQFITIEKLARWIEYDLLKNQLPRSTISLLTCEAAIGSSKYPAVAEQLYALFNNKPLKVTARNGFVYVNTNEKIFSYDTFKMLRQQAMYNATQSTPNNNLYERIGFSIIRGLDYLLNNTKLSIRDKSTPLNEKWVYFKNNKNVTYKIDKYLYDLYQLTSVDPIKNIEDLDKRDWIELAKKSINRNQNNKLATKALVVLNNHDKIMGAIELKIDLSTYEIKKNLISKLENIVTTATNNDSENKLNEIIKNMAITIKNFLEYRQPRNYSIVEFDSIINVLDNINKNNNINSNDIKIIEEYIETFSSNTKIKSDTNERLEPSGPRLPSYKKEILLVTAQKNKEFSDSLKSYSNILRKINIENNLKMQSIFKNNL